MGKLHKKQALFCGKKPNDFNDLAAAQKMLKNQALSGLVVFLQHPKKSEKNG